MLKRGGSRAADMVAQWHGSTRRYADRSVTSREPIDFVELPSIEEIEAFGNSDTSLEDMIKRYDAKTTKATSPLKLDPELFKDVVHDGQQGFPRIDGEYAHKAQAKAKAAAPAPVFNFGKSPASSTKGIKTPFNSSSSKRKKSGGSIVGGGPSY